MKSQGSAGVNWSAVIVGGIVVAAAAAVAVQSVPELAPIRRYTRDAEVFARHLPTHVQDLLADARQRLARAQTAFHLAQAESERALTAQFEEAKQRGSVPRL